MKIAYLAGEIPNFRNSTRYQRAKHLSEKNDLFLFLRKDSQIPKEIASKAKVKRGFISDFFYLLWRMNTVWRMNKDSHFDFLYSSHSPFAIVEGYLLKLLGIKWVIDIWDHPELPLEIGKGNFLRKLTERIAIALAKKVIRHADLIICAIMPEALKAYDIDQKKILPITNGVELEYVKPEGKKESSVEFKVFYVGYVYKIRGVNTLVKAISKLDNKIPAKLILAGEIDQETEIWLNDFISSYNLENVVEITGEIGHEKVLALTEESDVCVFPFPRKKGTEYIYPIKVFEYLAMGKPVVATNLKGVAQIIKHEENGLLVEPDNPEEMAKAILRIYEDKELREKLERNARKSILKYDWEIINNKIDNALNKLNDKES